MPREIELSSMVQGKRLALAEFTRRTLVQVRHRQLNWETGWNDVLQIGLYQKGPDISEVGSTWVENLTDMRAIRPFSQSELNSLGGESAFLAGAWPHADDSSSRLPVEGARVNGAPNAPRVISSIPWLLDTRLIHYRCDVLAKAGISPEHAFETPEAFNDTLCRLQAAGVEYPLSVATGGLSLHNLACFVWGRGGDFRSPDLRKFALVEPRARQGLFDFFRLHRFIHPEGRKLEYSGADRRYNEGQAAVLISGQWVMKFIKDKGDVAAPIVQQNTGYAAPPGVPYVGGTHLVIWRHSLHEQVDVQLLGYLTEPAVLGNLFQVSGNFPARIAALNAAPFADDRDYQLVAECMRHGRGFQSAHLWAGVEMRLSALCDQLWSDLFANPELDLQKEIEQRVVTLANRLEKTILASW
jgi:multiple sugar transport system substrate-binding protein